MPACETDFDVAGEWKETIIAYGLLDASKTKQYIRLNKAFLGEDINANTVAQIADSSAMSEPVTAVIKEYSDASYNNLSGTFPLSKIDAMQEGITKEDGTFYTSPHYLYMTDHALSGTKWYELSVKTGKGTEISARTPVIGDFQISRPSINNGFNLAGDDIIIRWKRVAAAVIYDCDITIHFVEYTQNATVPIDKEVKVNIFTGYDASGILANEDIEYKMPVEDFFSAILRDFDPNAVNDPSIISRDIEKITIAIHAGSQELATFNSITSAQLGITASQNLLSYTNIQGGLGLFAAIYSKSITDIDLTPTSYPIISCSDVGKILKFSLDPSDPSYPFDCD